MASVNGKITLAIIGTKLDAIAEKLTEHRTSFEKHVQDDADFRRDISVVIAGKEPSIATRLDRLEQSEARRVWHIRAIWASMISGATAWILK